MTHVSVVVPNWNGKKVLRDCLDSLLDQSIHPRVIVVENGSEDGSVAFLKKNYANKITLIEHDKNLGFAGGVNAGIRYAINNGDSYVALFNNDAVADKFWLEKLVTCLDHESDAGIVTCKLMSSDKKLLDSTGDFYTVWGLPYPRGRGELDNQQYDHKTSVFGASGGASLYKVTMLKEIGLFDEDFFAYYEDIDLSFRAQLAGYKIRYVPDSIAYHQIGATSSGIKGFTTHQTMKNLPWLIVKDVPAKYLLRVGLRFSIAYLTFFASAALRGQFWVASKGMAMSVLLLPKKLTERHHIQSHKKVVPSYVWGLFVYDLPPNAHKLRRVRSLWWKFTARKGVVHE
jgi:GT2 family glycosyltransferase